MGNADKFELHYYFGNDSHDINALLRNRCESELLGLIVETANLLGADSQLIKEAYREGGFRDIWKVVGRNVSELGVLLLIVQIIISAVPLFESKDKDLEIEERKLSIEEKKLNIEKLKNDIERGDNEKAINRAATAIGANLKILKRKSNLYSLIDAYRKVEKIGFLVLDENFCPVKDEVSIPRSEFRKYILGTNRLKSQEDDNAIIEIISPVLKEGRYKWRGVYNESPISFEMQDSTFRDSILVESIPFQHGTKIVCVLIIHRELDEVGDVKIIGYSVKTVLNKIDGGTQFETSQGRKYRYEKKMAESQGELLLLGGANE